MNRNLLTAATLTALCAITAGPALAAPVANWELFSGTPDTTSGLATDGPTIGDDTTDDANNVHLGSLIGANGSPESFTIATGDTVTLTGSVVISGGANVADNFRFGLFNDNGVAGATGWTGYLHSTSNGTYQGRTNGSFVSTGSNASSLGAVKVTTGSFDGDSETAFAFSMSITNNGTDVSIVSSLTGGDGTYSNSHTATDATSPYFTYNAVGFLLGGNLLADQAVFSNVSVAVPEPSSLALLGLGGLLVASRRRRDA